MIRSMRQLLPKRSKKSLLLSMCFVLLSTFGFSQLTVTKTYTPGSSVSIDGCGTYCTTLPNVTFSAADFAAGACAITDVNVNIVWAKTDGTCTAPNVGSSFHAETSFRLDGPTGNQEILAVPGTWSGNATISAVSTNFNQGSAIPFGTPVSGTFGPNNGNLNNFNGTNPFGSWALRAGDSGGGDPLCIASYSVTITVSTGLDTDGDGLCDGIDTDDDNDGVADGSDPSTLNPDICGDADGDGCDDCSIGTDNFGPLADNAPANDGADTDGDGLCDSGDPDDDNDGVADGSDTDPLNPFICGDADGDTCDDCAIGVDGFGPLADNNTANDGTDTDGDGICDTGDADDDNDGIIDGSDPNPLDPSICGDVDADGCDDCSVGTDGFGPLADNAPANDGIDTDSDGICDTGDTDDDNDGIVDVSDTDPLNPFVCQDLDADGCDDCAIGVDGFGPLADNNTANDGTDADGDGYCSITDCNDLDPLVNPGVIEIQCDGIDNDCNALTLDDSVDPTVVCQNINVYLDGSGNALLAASDLDGGSTDNCGPLTFSASVIAFTCADIGPNIVFLTASDGAGNTASCPSTVTVLDTISPTAVCQNISIYLDAGGNASIVAPDLDGGSSDVCGAVTLSASILNFSCAELGANNVTLTVNDANG
ncbi:MAG: hypothetical protein ACJA0U_002474, partial [Salibacteraceae bacterium]